MKKEDYLKLEKEAQRWAKETDCGQFETWELLAMFAASVIKNNSPLPDVSDNEIEARVTVCPYCENPHPHLYEDKGGCCEECHTIWAN